MNSKPRKRERLARLLENSRDAYHRVFRSPSPTPLGTQSNQANSISQKALLQMLKKSTSAIPGLKSAVDTLIDCFGNIPNFAENHQDYDSLRFNIAMDLKSLEVHMNSLKSSNMTQALEGVINELHEEAKLISEKQKRVDPSRFLYAGQDIDDLIRSYRRVEALFRRLHSDVVLSIWQIACETFDAVDDNLLETRLGMLDHVRNAHYDSSAGSQLRRVGCTPNTRRTVLRELQDWASNPRGAKVYWMNGMAGTGKTTIAYSLCNQLEKTHQLAASFFCSRSLPDCRNAARIIPTIAYQLARSFRPFQNILCQVLKNDPNLGGRAVMSQLQKLISEPIQAVKNDIPAGLLVVVIDALDECADRRDCALVLEALLRFADTLPIKFFITCRPDSEFLRAISYSGSLNPSLYHLHDIEESLVQADIEIYLRTELRTICARDEHIQHIAAQSGRLFIYAATVVKYIGLNNPTADHQERLGIILGMNPGSSSKAYQPLDTLYTTILAAALENCEPEPWESERIRMVLQTVICAWEPLTVGALAYILQLKNAEQSRRSVEPLWSVLHLDEQTGLVSTLHASFPDYMNNEARSGRFFYDQTKHHEFLARRCFETMSHMLRFNICNLESSFVIDKDVLDLSDRVSKTIPLHLFYACRYWTDHMLSSGEINGSLTLLDEFLRHRVLFWTEVMNLKHTTRVGVTMLSSCHNWMKTISSSENLLELCSDVQKFVAVVGANPVCKSTPHIYISVLGLWDKKAPVWSHYGAQTRGMVAAEGPAIENRESAALAVWRYSSVMYGIAVSPEGKCVVSWSVDGLMCIWDAHSGDILLRVLHESLSLPRCATFSPNGTYFASGFDNGAAYIWDTLTGRKVKGLQQGHTSRVCSVAYSPDGSRLASGSEDHTILVWNVLTGTVVAGPLSGHGSSVVSVAYSPDGKHIASGSHDYTVRIWDAQTGQQLVDPITGHTNRVYAVAYSPDGCFITSGSADHTVRIWDAHTGYSLMTPLHGHTAAVICVAYSPSGDRIVSGSDDCTVRVWDAQDGQTMSAPFSGHTSSVMSVAFMPDGNRFVSCSHDHTIRVWAAKALYVPTTVSEGHTGLVSSVAFSPDSACLASGSYDTTVCIWDTRTGKMTAGPLAGHKGRVTSVVFSPRDNYVASGSFDHTIRIWDVKTGELLIKPFTGHLMGVSSVAFSPNGNRVASGSWDCTVQVWDVKSGYATARPLTGYTKSIRSVAYSPDGECIVLCSDDETIRIWDEQTGETIAGPFNHDASSVAYSSNGTRILLSSYNGTISICDAITGIVTIGPCKGHTGQVNSAALSCDDRYIVSGSEDRTIRIWDTNTGQMITTPLHAHISDVTSVACSPDGNLMASASKDGAIRIWDFKKLMSSVPRNLSWVTMNADGWVLGHDLSLLLWVPPDLRVGLKWPQNVAVIHQKGSWELDFSNAYIGTNWMKCHASR